MDGSVCVWDPVTGNQIGETMGPHQKWVTCKIIYKIIIFIISIIIFKYIIIK